MRLIDIDGQEIGVIQVDDVVHAFANVCPHQGGPVCHGQLLPPVEAVLEEDGGIREHFAHDRLNLVCPWHGFEFDLLTGSCTSDRRFFLQRFEVVEDDDAVYVRA